MKRILIISFILTVLYTSFVCSEEIGRIGDKELLVGVKHKILVLEYDTPGPNTWGSDIAQIVANEILGSISSVKSFGIVNLHKPEETYEYSPENIDKLAQIQKTPVVIWGEFYQEKDNVYLHSHLKIIKQDSLPESDLKLKYIVRNLTAVNPDTLEANPPSMQFNFSPIKLSVRNLESLSLHYKKTTELRLEPYEMLAPFDRIGVGDAFYVLDRKDDWIMIQPRGKRAGWIRYKTTDEALELEDIRGLVKLAQGIMQYFAGSYHAAIETLNEYQSIYASEQDVMNRALSHIVLGNTKYKSYQTEGKLAINSDIFSEFKVAKNLLPYSTTVINYFAVLSFAKYSQYKDLDVNTENLEEELIKSINIQNNPETIKNLLAYYKLSLKYDSLRPDNLNVTDYESMIKPRIEQLNILIDKTK